MSRSQRVAWFIASVALADATISGALVTSGGRPGGTDARGLGAASPSGGAVSGADGDPCGLIPRDAAHLDAMAACTSAQPLSADEAATIPTAATDAVGELQTFGRTEAADSYAGVARDGTAYVLHYVPNVASANKLVARALAAGMTAVPATYTLADLHTATNAIAKRPNPLKPFDIYPDVTRNAVVVRSRTVSAAALRQFYRAWDAQKTIVQLDDTTTFAVNHVRRTRGR